MIIIAVLRALIRLFISDAHELEGGLIDTTPLAIRLTTTHFIIFYANQAGANSNTYLLLFTTVTMTFLISIDNRFIVLNFT